MTGLNGAADQESFSEMMKGLSEFQLAKKEKEEDEAGWTLGERPDFAEGVLESLTENLELRS